MLVYSTWEIFQGISTEKKTSIGGMLASSVVNRGFELRSGRTKDYEIGICCFSAKQAALWKKSED